VERGRVESTVTASGHVVPEHEHVLTSPLDSRVLEVSRRPGAEVEPGEAIVLLDATEAALAVEKLDEEIALKQNDRKRAGLALESTLADLERRREIKELELRSLEIDVAKNRRLFESELITEDVLRGFETDAERARIELAHLDESRGHAERALQAELEGLDLEIRILLKDREEAARRAEGAAVASDRPGIVTWVAESEGASVRKGDVVARVADLSSFRVEATLADVHARLIAVGQPAHVRSGDLDLAGRVARVLPTVENGAIPFEVSLDQSAHPSLRHNLRVNVDVVTDRRDDALRVPRCAHVNVEGRRAVFRVDGDRAVRTYVEFGLMSFDTYEVTSGLEEGDVIILSDMSDHANVKEVRLR
jgi:HlyD family secretion protein